MSEETSSYIVPFVWKQHQIPYGLCRQGYTRVIYIRRSVHSRFYHWCM